MNIEQKYIEMTRKIKTLEDEGHREKAETIHRHMGFALQKVDHRPSLLEEYYNFLKTPSEESREEAADIQEHLETLKNLSMGLDHITEMGFRTGTSFTAFLMAQPKKLVTYDLYIPDNYKEKLISMRGATELVFHEENTLTAVIEQTDLLFIDTLHTYGQLRQELTRHADKVKKYLVFHDTETYGRKGENKESLGLMDAIEDFLLKNKHFELIAHYPNNNGLTVLEKKGPKAVEPEIPNPIQ